MKRKILALALTLAMTAALVPALRAPAAAVRVDSGYTALLQEIRDNISSGRFRTPFTGYSNQDVEWSGMSAPAKAYFSCKWMDSDNSDLRKTMYAVTDLDGNGTQELLLTTARLNLDTLCTLRNGSPVEVRSFAYRDGGDIHGKYVESSGSSGAATGGTTFYKLNGDKLTTVLSLTYDYTRGNPAWFMGSKQITQAQVSSYRDQYRAGAEPTWYPLVTSTPFFDVVSTDWYSGDVSYVNGKGLMTGVTANGFAPENPATRAQLITILYRMAGSPSAKTNPFSDVASGVWYDRAVSWAYANGIVNGTGNGQFSPNAPVTREQFAVILQNYAKYKKISVKKTADLFDYHDAGKISGYAKDAMGWANAVDLITGTDQKMLNPQGKATRAQTAAILHRFCENVVR